MAFIKLTKDKYPNKGDIIKLMYYLCNYSKCEHELCGGRNIMSSIMYAPQFIGEQFLIVQQGERFERRAYHLIINFDEALDNADIHFAYRVGHVISNLYPDYQSVFVVHEDKIAPHIHIVFNNCPVSSDKPKLTSIFNVLQVRSIVENMIMNHLGIVIG